MQVVLERISIAAFVLWPCLFCPVQASEFKTSPDSNANTARSAIAKQQAGQDHQSIDSTSSELPIRFAARFVQSCTSSQAGDNEFYLSRIGIPLKYVFSFIDEGGKRSTQGTLFEMQKNPATGRFILPLCIGDGGLDETRIRVHGEDLKIELIFGSGPNGELHFKNFKGQWKLVFVEWIDH